MARRLKLEIGETAEYLEKSLKQAYSASQKERLLMLWWLKTGQVTEHQELSRRLGRSPACITRWLSQYRGGGLKQLLEVKTALLCRAEDSGRSQARSYKPASSQKPGLAVMGRL